MKALELRVVSSPLRGKLNGWVVRLTLESILKIPNDDWLEPTMFENCEACFLVPE